MKSVIFFTSYVAALLAAPMLWSPEMALFYSVTNQHIMKARQDGLRNPPSCDLSRVNITAYLATIPNSPAVKEPGTAKLVHVTVGRGIQNYTCADNKESTKPKAIGAVANLYNVSCIAANYPDLLSLIPPFSVQYNSSLDSSGRLTWTTIERTGHHFFNAAGSPVFDLNDDQSNPLGVLVADGKNPDMKVDAPITAIKGQTMSTNGQTGAVPWLKLNSQFGTTENLTQVYRVDTAGGSPPATCMGQPALISVEYSAQYWFFKSS